MRNWFIIIVCIMFAPRVSAQYVDINVDTKTIAAMEAVLLENLGIEAVYNSELNSIMKNYGNAMAGASVIYMSKHFDRKALTNLGIWSSSTENYYYKRIYQMVTFRIMPKIWRVGGLMLKRPQNAIYWGSYLLKICEETKALCMQFESVVTNSSLSFRDVTFLTINHELADLFRLQNLGNSDWVNTLDNFSDINVNITKQSLAASVEELVNSFKNLAIAGGDLSALLQGQAIHKSISDKVNTIHNLTNTFYNIYQNTMGSLGNTVLSVIGGEGVSKLFEPSDYDLNAWTDDYIPDEKGQYYRQRWYIVAKDTVGGGIEEEVMRYYPVENDYEVFHGDAWVRFEVGDRMQELTDAQKETVLANSESVCGYSRNWVAMKNGSNDGYKYEFHYNMLMNTLNINGNGTLTQMQNAYACEIWITRRSLGKTEKTIVYEDIYDSYSMDLETFMAGMQAMLEEFQLDHPDVNYSIESDPPNYYETTDAEKMKGIDLASIAVTCYEQVEMAANKTHYKCKSCGKTVSDHTHECAMLTTLPNDGFDTSEIDQKIDSLNTELSNVKLQIKTLGEENERLFALSKDNSIPIIERNKYASQFNTNLTTIEKLQVQQSTIEAQIKELEQARIELEKGEAELTDEHYRIPAIMHDIETTFHVRWTEPGSWQGNSFVRKGSLSDLADTIIFTATISIVRKPQYFLGIKIHRAIVQIEWKLTSEQYNTHVEEIVEFDSSMDEQQKSEMLNEKISKIAQDYPDCSITVQYARTDSVEADNTQDTYHLLWSSDRLEIAREVDARLHRIYANLVSYERFMSYKLNIIDMLMNKIPINYEQGRRLSLVEQARRNWLRNAANTKHSDAYNGKYDEDIEQ